MTIEETIRLAVRDAVRDELKPLLERLQAPAQTGPAYITIGEAATVAGVCRDTIRAWVHGGKLRRYGTETTWRVSRADLAALMEGTRPDEPTEEEIEERAVAHLARRR